MKIQTEKNAIRLDKWLWAARFYKTRTLARQMIDGGKVYYNGQRSRAGKSVELGAEIRLRQGNSERTVIVVQLASERKRAVGAEQMYAETEESINKRNHLAEMRRLGVLTMPHPNRRPDKKERRTLMQFKNEQK